MGPKLSQQICPRFQTAMDVLGRRWTVLVIYSLADGPRRFGELAGRLEVISERMLSERLKELAAEGIVERRVIPEPPVQVEYRLTDKGQALRSVLGAIGQWAETWVTPPSSRPSPRKREEGDDGRRGKRDAS